MQLLAVFIFQESWLVASGISYRAKKDNVPEEFNSLRCGKFCAIIFLDKATNMSTQWNGSILSWMKNYIYMRLIDRTLPRNKFQFLPVIGTYVCSILWHGFSIGFTLALFGMFSASLCWSMYEESVLGAQIRSLLSRMPALLWLFHHVLSATLGGLTV